MHFQTPHKVSHVLTIICTTYIKTIFSISPGTDKHFIGNELCSSDDYVTQLIRILRLLTTNNVFYKPHKKSKESNVENEGTRECPPLPIQRLGISISRKTQDEGEVRWCVI